MFVLGPARASYLMGEPTNCSDGSDLAAALLAGSGALEPRDSERDAFMWAQMSATLSRSSAGAALR